MARNRFVRPVSVRKPLEDSDDWVELKETLNVGEQKQVESCGLGAPVLLGERIVCPINWTVHDLERAMIFLTAWNLKDEEGLQRPLNFDSLKALDPETFEEINGIILRHVLEIATAKKSQRAAEQKTLSEGSSKSSSLPAESPSDPTSE